MTACSVVVFDLGGVLIHWDPRLLYRKMLPTDAAVEQFLATVCTPEWNARQDAGRPLDEGIAELVARFPEQVVLIEAWRDRFAEMLRPIPDTVQLLRELRERQVPLYALSNWGAQTFDATRNLFPFLDWFHGLCISGKVGLVKPDPAIFRHLLSEHQLDAADVVFVDDHPPNVEAARRMGLQAVLFRSAPDLRGALARFGLLS